MSEWVLSVGQLNEYVRKQLAGDPLLNRLRVRGELSGFKRHTSGHLYFTLKDGDARVQCVMFRQHAMGLSFQPRDGQRVVVSGAASLYAATGTFQVYCDGMRAEGAGALYEQFEALKAKLMLEGLFDPARKRPLPLVPRAVGIVTSRTGAALRDMVRVIRRRYPGMAVVLSPCAVQGEGAAAEIAAALDRLYARGGVDVILCGRGGGSMEDLWAFNEEIVARAIARANVPVVSCVGHETDFTIADFVADVRAATPSVAAELAVPERAALEDELRASRMRLARALRGRLALHRARLERLIGSQALRDPRRALIEQRRTALDALLRRLDAAYLTDKAARRARLDTLSRALIALSPMNVLHRGYAIVTGEHGIATRAAALAPGMPIGIRFADGTARAAVTEVRKEESAHGQ